MLFLFDRLACCISLLFLFFMRFLIFLGWSEIECRIYSPQSISQTIIYCSSSSLVDYVGENLEVPAAETAEGEVLDFLEVMEDGGCSMGIYGINVRLWEDVREDSVGTWILKIRGILWGDMRLLRAIFSWVFDFGIIFWVIIWWELGDVVDLHRRFCS